MVAALLLFFVIVETFLVGWLLRQVADMRKVCKMLGDDVMRLSTELGALVADGSDTQVAQSPVEPVQVDTATLDAAMGVLNNASPEELAQAKELLKAMGLGG